MQLVMVADRSDEYSKAEIDPVLKKKRGENKGRWIRGRPSPVWRVRTIT